MIKKTKPLIALAALCSAFGISEAVSADTAAGIQAIQTPVEYIVAFSDDGGDLGVLNTVISNALGRSVEVGDTFERLITGEVVSITSAEATILRNIDGLTVSRNVTYAEPEAEGSGNVVTNPENSEYSNYTQETIGLDYSEAANAGAGIKIGILDTGLFYDQIGDGTGGYAAFQPLTGDDELTDLSYSKSDVEDLINENSDLLSGGKYINSKIIYAYDVADGDSSVQPKDGNEHGTHVASLAAGNNGSVYQGVAPNAQLAILKVFSDASSGASTSDIIVALEIADALGLDVVNLSLGSPFSNENGYNSDDNIEYRVIEELRANGTIVNVAAGNDGRGQWSGIYSNYVGTSMVETGELGSYGVLDPAVVVGSSTLTHANSYYWTVNNNDEYVISPVDQVTGGASFSDLVESSGDQVEWQIVGEVGANGIASDYATVDVTGKVAVVWRGGGNTFENMAKQAQAFGADALLVINNTTESVSMSFGTFTPSIPVVLITMSEGAYFETGELSGTLVYNAEVVENPLEYTMSDFSTDGVTSDLRIKPDITAPGTDILGAVRGGYEEMSGTSMATPNLSGAFAVLLGEHADSAEQLAEYKKSILARTQSTATILHDDVSSAGATTGNLYDADGEVVGTFDDSATSKDANETEHQLYNFASPKNQGAGQVNVGNALSSDVWLSTGTVGDDYVAKIETGTLNLQTENIDFPEITAHNESSENITYDVQFYVALPQTTIPIDSTTWGNFTSTAQEIFPSGFTSTYMKSNNLYFAGMIDLGDVIANADGTTTWNIDDLDLTSDSTHPVATVIRNYANAWYEDGVTLEGYLIFTPTDSGHTDAPQLNLPFLGYYGDYGAADATEEFDFERGNTTQIQTSDLANAFAQSYIGYENAYADYGSHIFGVSGFNGPTGTGKTTSNDAMVALAYYWMGAADLETNYGAYKLGYNDDIGTYNDGVVAGVEGYTDQLLIQQFVQRDMQEATVSLYRKATSTGQTDTLISTNQMYSYPGFDEDAEANDVFGTKLYRSLPTQSGLTGGYYVPMAGAFVDLTGLSEGEYYLEFSYTLMAQDEKGENYVQTKDVDITIETSSPSILSVSQDAGSNILTCSSNAEYVTFTADQVRTVRLYENTDGTKYIYVPTTYLDGGIARVTVYSANGQSVSCVIDMRSTTYLTLFGDTSSVGIFTASTSTGTDDTGDYVTYTITALDSAGSVDYGFLFSTHGYALCVEAGLENPTFYYVNATGRKVILSSSQYTYDSETGYLIITSLPSGTTGVGYYL